MSSTKGVLVKLLKRLVGYWDLAEGFLLLVQQSDNEEFIEELLAFMKNQIKKIKNTQQRIAIKTKLEQIAAEESEDQENAEKILDDLLLNM